MITLNTDNLLSIEEQHGLTAGEIEKERTLLSGYLKEIEKMDQGFYQVIDDTALLDKIESFAANASGKFNDVVILGIGGSALGTICLQQSLTHLFAGPKLHVIDNIDPILIKEISEVITPTNTLFIVVTKSGSTPETLAQYFYFRDLLTKNGVTEPQKNFVFITDPQKGLLRKIANEEGIITFDIPENVGGRFSVLTAVGLLPASLIGINIRELVSGAQSMRDNFLENSADNLPFRLATIQYLLYKKGKHINVLMPYAQKLIKFADWYRQLLAESTGKKISRTGEKINVGITPINALGATDQHSQSQLYNEGPNDKLIILLKVNDFGHEVEIPNVYPLEESVSYLNNISFNELINTELKGTAEALTEYVRPNITIEIDRINARTLGELFMLFEGATAFLGEFFNINAFDQPGVELSKQLTKQLLTTHGNSTKPNTSTETR